ncbi:MAG: ABC transporter substrate-binding protein [Acidimicrobiales bacterium]
MTTHPVPRPRPSRTARRRPAVVLAATAGLLLVACSTASSSDTRAGTVPPAGQEHGRSTVDEGEPRYGGNLVVGVLADSDGYHPVKNNWTTEGHLVGSSVIEPLMAYGPDGKLQPWLAESITPNEDLTVWTVTVRPGITFHDGTPLDAEAVRMNLQSAMFEGLASIAFEGVVKQVVVTGDRTLQIHLNGPYAVIPEVLAGVAGYVAAPSMLRDPEGGKHPSGTGPFRFEEWLPGSSFRATRNDAYWRTDEQGRKLPYLDSIEFQFVLDDAARFTALQAGDVDLIMTTRVADIVAARDRSDLVSAEDNLSEETFVMLNAGAAPFDNVHAREALAYGTDPAAVVQVTQDGQALVATSPFAPGTDWAASSPATSATTPSAPARPRRPTRPTPASRSPSGSRVCRPTSRSRSSSCSNSSGPSWASPRRSTPSSRSPTSPGPPSAATKRPGSAATATTTRSTCTRSSTHGSGRARGSSRPTSPR